MNIKIIKFLKHFQNMTWCNSKTTHKASGDTSMRHGYMVKQFVASCEFHVKKYYHTLRRASEEI